MFSISLNVSLCKTKIKNENFVGSFVQPNTKIIRLDVTVDKVSVMHILNSCNHLINEHKDSLEGKLSESLIKQRL